MNSQKRPQFACYAAAIASAHSDKPVVGDGVNRISYGVVSLLSGKPDTIRPSACMPF